MNTETDFHSPTTQSHFLVTGGGKGITAENVIALAEAFQSRFTLVGRSSLLETEPAWAAGQEQDADLKAAALDYFNAKGKKISPREVEKEVKSVLSSREIRNTLEKINKAGGDGEYLQADITNLETLTSQLGDRVHDVDGVIHGAGALADKYIQDKTEADFDLVYGVKITGIKNLLNIVQPGQLKYLVLFSSVAGFYGNAGQADYSLANEILNKLAHHLKMLHPECQVLSIGWGPWDGGMVTPQLKRIFERRNIPLISPEAGTGALIELLSVPQDTPQVIIGNPLPTPPRKMDSKLKSYLIRRELALHDNPFLADHVIGGNAVLPTVCAVAWFVNSCTALYPEYQFHAVRDYRVFKGIIFENEIPRQYSLVIEELEKNTEHISFQGKISSEGEGGKQRFHYQAEIELRSNLPERPQIADFDLSPTATIAGDDLYHEKVLFHGPGFQGVKQVLNINPDGLTIECRQLSTPHDRMGQFPIDDFNPILADVHLQSLLIWAHHQKQTTGLPLQIREGIQYQKVPQKEITYATMRVKKVTAHKLVADVFSHDREGRIFTRVNDAEITLNDRLSDLFQQNQLVEQRLA